MLTMMADCTIIWSKQCIYNCQIIPLQRTCTRSMNVNRVHYATYGCQIHCAEMPKNWQRFPEISWIAGRLFIRWFHACVVVHLIRSEKKMSHKSAEQTGKAFYPSF